MTISRNEDSHPVLSIIETILSFIVIILALSYVLPYIVCFIKHRNTPLLKMRSPFLVIISSCSIFIQLVLISLPRLMAPGFSQFSDNKIAIICSLRRFEIDLLNFLIALPYLIRAARVYFLKKQIDGLLNQELSIIKKSLVHQKILAFILLCFSLILLTYAIVDIFTAKSSSVWSPADLYRSCIYADQSENSPLPSWLIFIIFYSLFQVTLVYFVYRLRGIKERINIFRELAFFAVVWLIINILVCVQFALQNSPFIYSEGHFAMAVLLIAIFTVSVPVQITRRKKYTAIEDCSGLLQEFPECLHFWVCNFYFHQYLQAEKPQYVPLRPLLADIMRYEFGSDDTRESFSLSAQRSRAIDIYFNYFRPEGPHYFDWSNFGDLKEDIERRFDDLDQNLDEFLFEFVITQVVELLSPVYKEFCQTLYFKRMEAQSTRDEIFANVLQY